MAKPSPEPRVLFVVKNGSMQFRKVSSLIPTPVSDISRRICLPTSVLDHIVQIHCLAMFAASTWPVELAQAFHHFCVVAPGENHFLKVSSCLGINRKPFKVGDEHVTVSEDNHPVFQQWKSSPADLPASILRSRISIRSALNQKARSKTFQNPLGSECCDKAQQFRRPSAAATMTPLHARRVRQHNGKDSPVAQSPRPEAPALLRRKHQEAAAPVFDKNQQWPCEQLPRSRPQCARFDGADSSRGSPA